MNTRDLEAFLAVVETGSIVGAAARLHLTQPGISRRIQVLEELLGHVLLDRQSKPLKPTAAGREAYQYGRRVLQSLDDLRSGLAPEGAIGGELRLGLTPYMSEIAMARPFDLVRQHYPQLTLQIITDWQAPLLDRLQRGEIDVAAFHLPEGQQPPLELEAEAFELRDLHVIAAKTLGLRSPTCLQQLSSQPWVLNQEGCGFRQTLKRRFEQQGLPFQIAIEAPSSDLRLSLVARGIGLTLATRHALDCSPLRGQLEIITITDFHPRARAWLVHRPPAGRLSQPIQCLQQALGQL